MQFEEMPEPIKEYLLYLKYSSSSIENDVSDAMNQSETINEFCEIAIGKMNALISEAKKSIELINKISEVKYD